MKDFILLEEGLRKDISMIVEILKNEIALIKKGEKRKINNDLTELLKKINEYQNIVQNSRKFLLIKKDVNDETRKLITRLEYEWKNILYPLIEEYDNCVVEYNKNNYPRLKKISDRIGNKIFNSVKTFKYFNY